MGQLESPSHSVWECKYRVAFIPKCRCRVRYEGLRQASQDSRRPDSLRIHCQNPDTNSATFYSWPNPPLRGTKHLSRFSWPSTSRGASLYSFACFHATQGWLVGLKMGLPTKSPLRLSGAHHGSVACRAGAIRSWEYSIAEHKATFRE